MSSFLSLIIPPVEQQEVGRSQTTSAVRGSRWEGCFSASPKGNGPDQASGGAAAPPCFTLPHMRNWEASISHFWCKPPPTACKSHTQTLLSPERAGWKVEWGYWWAAGIWGTCMRKKQAKAAEAAAQGCLGTMPKPWVGFPLGVRRGRVRVFAMAVPPLGWSTSIDQPQKLLLGAWRWNFVAWPRYKTPVWVF